MYVYSWQKNDKKILLHDTIYHVITFIILYKY